MNVTISAECSWTATSQVDWIRINSGNNGQGNGTVNFTVTANTADLPRSGGMTIAGQVFVINQVGAHVSSRTEIFVPIVLSSGGLNGAFFTSELTITNRSTQSTILNLTYISAFGEGSGTASTVLAGGRQLIVPDAIAYLRNLGIPIPATGNQGGTLKADFSGVSSSEVSLIVRTTTSLPNGRAGLAYPGIPTNEVLSGTSYLCGLRQNSIDRSNVALQNVGSEADGDITLRLTVYSGDPSPPFQQTLPDVILYPGGFTQISQILISNGMSLTNGFVRIERVSGRSRYYAYAVINDQFNSDGSFVPPTQDGNNTGMSKVTLPVIVETNTFSSELILTNYSGVAKILRCHFVADAIQTPDSTATFEITIRSGEQLIWTDLVQFLRETGTIGIGPKGTTFVGPLFAEVTHGDMSGVSLGARTSSPGGGGQFGLYYNAVFSDISSPSVWICGIQQNADNRTNLALVNTGEMDDSTNTFSLELFDGETGIKQNTVDGISLKAKGWMQINSVLDQYAPGIDHGYARIVRKVGSNPFIVYAVINDGGHVGERTGDGAFVSSSH